MSANDDPLNIFRDPSKVDWRSEEETAYDGLDERVTALEEGEGGGDVSALTARVTDLEATRATTAALSSGLAGKADSTALTNGLATKASTASVTALTGRVTAIESITERRPATSRGAVAFSWDDGWDTHPTVAQWHADRGQVATFYVTTGELDGAQHMPTAAVAQIHALGHEIGAHNVSHTSMTSGATPASRQSQWDAAKATLEGLIGERVVSYAYPLGDHDATTDREAYGRYDRVAYVGLSQGFAGTSAKAGTWQITPSYSSFGHGRFPWNQSTHTQFMAILRDQVFTQGLVIPTYAHQVGNPDTPTEAQVLEALDFCEANGIRTLTARDALPGPMLVNPGFEDGLNGWTVIKAGTGGTASVVEVATDAPATGFGGTKSLKLTSAASTTSDSVRIVQSVAVDPRERYTFSGQIRHDADKAGTGFFSLRVNEYDENGRSLTGRNFRSNGSTTTWAQTLGVATSPADPDPGGPLARPDFAYLPPNSLHPDCRIVEIGLYITNATGTFYADHIHFGPTRNGVLG